MAEKKTKTKAAKEKKKPTKKAVALKTAKVKTTKKTVKKPKVKKIIKKEKETKKKAETKAEAKDIKLKYYEAVGSRKRAVARVRIFTKGDKGFFVNKKKYTEYFKTPELQGAADGALRKMKVEDKFNISVFVRGGGIAGQAEAVRHGIARALLKFNPDFRKRLKRVGYLRRDPREKERRKFGLKKARKAPQWSKR